MKHNKLFLALLLILLLVLSSCKDAQNIPEITTEYKENQTESNKGDTNYTIFSELNLPSTYGEDEYNKFIRQNNLPERFIYYDSLKGMGVLKTFTIQSYDCSELYYSFIDNSNNRLAIYIHDEKVKPYVSKVSPEITYVNLTESDINRFDMRTSENKARNSIYIENGIEYEYVKGNLNSISWRANDYLYILVGSSFMNDINIESPTFVSSLLTSTKTIPEIMAQISLPVVAE